MAYAIRNFCVARGTLTSGTSATLYTVPVGHSLILKAIDYSNLAASAQDLVTAYQSASGSSQVQGSKINVPASAGGHWAGWAVLNESDRLVLFYVAVNVVYWVSGALLPSVPGTTVQARPALPEGEPQPVGVGEPTPVEGPPPRGLV